MRTLSTAVILALAVFLGAACGTGASTDSTAPTSSTTTSVATTLPPTTTTTAVPTTTTVAPTTTTTTTPQPPPPPVYRRGDEGPEVRAIQEKLTSIGYWIPVVDGTYGYLTSQAVMAFQKVEGLGRDGLAGPETMAALFGAERPSPARVEGTHVEVDLARQVVFFVRDGRVEHVWNASTGRAGWRTPPGEFTVTREIDGMRNAPLGQLWRPKYFNGGIALHGSTSVPAFPASHGCVRVSNAAMDFIWTASIVPKGTVVLVV